MFQRDNKQNTNEIIKTLENTMFSRVFLYSKICDFWCLVFVLVFIAYEFAILRSIISASFLLLDSKTSA